MKGFVMQPTIAKTNDLQQKLKIECFTDKTFKIGVAVDTPLPCMETISQLGK